SSSSSPGRKKPRVIWLTLFFVTYSLAFGIALVPRINLVVSLICRQTPLLDPDAPPVVVGGFNPQCQVDAVSAHTAMVQSAGNVVSGVLSMGMSAWLSALSDRVGRVKIVAYAAVVLMCVEVVLVALARAPEGTSYRWLFVAYTLDGLSGSFAVAMAMASAYISDCVDEEKRNVEVGRIHGSMFIGIAAGPAISSAIIAGTQEQSPLLVFYIGLAMRAVAIIYLLTCVAESLPSARKGFRSAFIPSATRWQQITKPTRGINAILIKLSKLNPVKWLDRLVPPGSPNSRARRRNVILLIGIDIICYAGALSTSDVLILYPQVVFKWGNVENNMFMSVVNGFRAIVSTLGIPVLIFLFQRRTPNHPLSAANLLVDPLDRTLILTALLFDIFGYVGYAASPNGILFTLCGAAAAFGAVGLSTSEAALTKSKVGELMAGLGLLQSVVRIVAPAVVNVVYGATVAVGWPGIAFWGVAGVLGVGVALTMGLAVG
ncbi:major facilitator superfamily domain-containing protein, partial [Macrophomina phaseolina]